jgi:hypothetical protein
LTQIPASSSASAGQIIEKPRRSKQKLTGLEAPALPAAIVSQGTRYYQR